MKSTKALKIWLTVIGFLGFIITITYCKKPACQRGAEYKECGPVCPPTCQKPTPDPDCPKNCSRDCFCKPGLLLNLEDTTCLTARKCPKTKCENGTEYRQCGTACPPTCKVPDPIVCTMNCVSGCFCKKGTVLNDDKKCVPLDKC